MDARPDTPTLAPRLRAARIVWGACVGVLVGYYAILVFLIPREVTGLDPEFADQFGRILLPVAGAATILAWFVYRRLAESTNAALASDDGGETGQAVASRAEQPVLATYVTCWALGDGIAVLGLVTGVLGGAMITATIFLIWALALLLVTRPQPMHFPPLRVL